MDRFLLRIQLGYPERSVERTLLRERGSEDPVAALTPVIDRATIAAAQRAVEQVAIAEPLLDFYALAIIDQTRTSAQITVGVSTRGAPWDPRRPGPRPGRGRVLRARRFQTAGGAGHRPPRHAAVDPRLAGPHPGEAERIVAELVARCPVPT
ncbi:MAG: hypothetical protein R3B06_12990 [Kofleriaceae bacterium]